MTASSDKRAKYTDGERDRARAMRAAGDTDHRGRRDGTR